MPKKILFMFLSFSLSSILILLVIEISFRFFDFPFKPTVLPLESALGKYDSELGWSYIPNQSSTQKFGTEQRKIAIHFDEIGSRVPGPEKQLNSVTPSIIFFGDSITMGHGLTYEESFVGQVNSALGSQFQIINLGVQAYGTDQSLLMMKRYLKKFNTKAVVYAFNYSHVRRNAYNDRRYLFPHLRFLGTKPLFALKPNGKLFLKEKPIQYAQLTYSRVWAYARLLWIKWGPLPSLNLTRSIVNEMNNYVEANGAKFLLILWHQTYLVPTYGGAPFKGMNLNMIDTGVNSPPGWHEWTIPGDGHPNARSHLHVAGLVIERIKHLNLND